MGIEKLQSWQAEKLSQAHLRLAVMEGQCPAAGQLEGHR